MLYQCNRKIKFIVDLGLITWMSIVITIVIVSLWLRGIFTAMSNIYDGNFF